MSCYWSGSSGESDLVFSEDSESEIIAFNKDYSVLTSKTSTSDSAPKPSTSLADPPLETTASGSKALTLTSEDTLKGSIEEGKFILVTWNNMTYPGLVMSIDENGAIVDCMQPYKKGLLEHKNNNCF